MLEAEGGGRYGRSTHFDPSAAPKAVSKETIPEGPILGVATGTLPLVLCLLLSAILATLHVCSGQRSLSSVKHTLKVLYPAVSTGTTDKGRK